MSIASEIQALQQDKSDIATAISNKGVTVPSNSGFDSFAGLIENIHNGYKTQYVEDKFVGTKSTLGPYVLDFEPKAVVIKCNEAQATIYKNMTLASAANTLSLMSGFLLEPGFVSTSNVPSFVWMKKTATSTDMEIVIRNLGSIMHKTYDSQTGKWNISFYNNDVGSYAFRFYCSEVGAFQLVFIGD